ncbi:hypothetical protein SEA_RAHUL_18 [Gordonia phage Rahul]|nr:hypothetical protein SEA_RAHUL_18 [Gordonia phage Rahul]
MFFENVIYTITNGAITPDMIHAFYAQHGAGITRAIESAQAFLNSLGG